MLQGSRADALSVIGRRLHSSVDGHGALILIGGEAGLGKTSLALACQDQALELGALFVTGRCYEWGMAPYLLWQEVFRNIAHASGASLETLPEPFGSGSPANSVHHLLQTVTRVVTEHGGQNASGAAAG